MGDEKKFIAEFSDRIICCFKQNWHAKIENDSKYSWFSSFKSILQPEKYLLIVTNKWYRDSLARFRSRTLGLRANKNWFISAGSMNNYCLFCSDKSIAEDENHFLFECKAYDDVRMKSALFKREAARRQDIISLLSTNDNRIIVALAKYIADANNIRKSLIAKQM